MGLIDRLFGPDEIESEGGRQVQEIPVSQVFTNPTQPRRIFDEAAIDELSASIVELGLIQPIVVRADSDGRYELVAGERRLRATRKAGIDVIPAIVVQMNEQKAAEVSLVENIQRQDLHYFEEAESYRRLIDLFGVTQEEMGRRIGKSRQLIQSRLKLLELNQKVREAVLNAGLTEGHARALCRLTDEAAQLSGVAVAREKGLSVRELERWVDARKAGFYRTEKPNKEAAVKGPDVQVVMSLLGHVVRDMRKAGSNVRMKHKATDKGLEVTILIPSEAADSGRKEKAK